MKKIQGYILGIGLGLIFSQLPTADLISQAPQGLNYQAVARKSDGSILQTQNIRIRYTITNQNGGTVLYQETQSTTTNEFGLFTLHVGNGTPTSGTFSSIDWAAVTPWLQVEIDPEGGSAYVNMGSSPLLSVPYALYAANSGGDSVWDTSGTNIFFNNNVGIGTQEPSAPLTIQTEINEIGFTHTTGAGSTTLSTSITDVGASIGTTSDDIFSLTAGGAAKLHVWPDGRVIIGDDADPSNISGENTSTRSTDILAKLHIATPINSAGWLHVGGADSIIVSEGIGGVSAALGTVTNHIFRLNSGGQGRLHLLPDGNVIVGTNAQGPIGKFTVHTPNNSDGISHVSDGGIVMKTIVGGVSAGFGTFSNHMMRIFSNSVAVINIDPAGNIGIGTLDPLPGYRLSVNGNMKAKELVIETTGWPDYVFDDGYKLVSLHELEKFIHQNRHLPHVPSALDIEENGLHVGDAQKKMMELIEELTLHIIALNKRIESLENHNRP
ncbi:MAG TPA: hypothetical protein VI603_15790 [Saprospiraceae bacterium]|nr:hypothetical protein [Saprospiraceae bacterium]